MQGRRRPHLKTRKQSSMLMCHRRTVLSMEAVSRNCDFDQAKSRTSAVCPTYVLCGAFWSTGQSTSVPAPDTDGFDVSTPAHGQAGWAVVYTLLRLTLGRVPHNACVSQAVTAGYWLEPRA